MWSTFCVLVSLFLSLLCSFSCKGKFFIFWYNFLYPICGRCVRNIQDQSAFPPRDCVFRFVYLDLYSSGDQLHSHLQVRCSWWIAFSTAHSSLLGLKSYHLRSEIKKIGSIQWWAGNLIESARPLFWHQEDWVCQNSIDAIFHWKSNEGWGGGGSGCFIWGWVLFSNVAQLQIL